MGQLLALPFKLVAWIIEAFGRLIAILIGLVLVIVGLAARPDLIARDNP